MFLFCHFIFWCVLFLITPSSFAISAPLELGWLIDLGFPYVETFLLALLTFFISWVAHAFKRLTGIQIDQKHSKALHEALERAVQYGLQKIKIEAKSYSRLETENMLIAKAAGYLEKTMPDTLNHFNLSAAHLDALILPYLPDLKYQDSSYNNIETPL